MLDVKDRESLKGKIRKAKIVCCLQLLAVVAGTASAATQAASPRAPKNRIGHVQTGRMRLRGGDGQHAGRAEAAYLPRCRDALSAEACALALWGGGASRPQGLLHEPGLQSRTVTFTYKGGCAWNVAGDVTAWDLNLCSALGDSIGFTPSRGELYASVTVHDVSGLPVEGNLGVASTDLTSFCGSLSHYEVTPGSSYWIVLDEPAVDPACPSAATEGTISVTLTSTRPPAVPRTPPAAAYPLHFARPVALPQGSVVSEPTVVVDSAGRVYVSAPNSIGAGQNSPLWVSLDGGRHFSEHATCSLGPVSTPLGGGDTALALDERGVLYGLDLWLGDDSVWYSTDHGGSCTGSPVSHRPVDDRPWLAYSAKNDALYQVYDGYDGLWVARADLGTLGPAAALSFAFNNEIAPESAVGNGSANPYVRAGAEWPGGIAVDPHSGAVYVSWADQFGLAIAKSTDEGLTWTINHIPGTQVTGSLLDDSWNFDPLAVDANGTLYATWNQVVGTPAAPRAVGVWLGVSHDGGAHWTKLRLASQTTTVFATLTVIAPGRVGVGWVDTAVSGNPNNNSQFSQARWRLQFAEVTAGRRFTVREGTVDPDVHDGTLDVGGLGGGGDRSMGDFFSMATMPDRQVVVAFTGGSNTASPPTVATYVAFSQFRG